MDWKQTRAELAELASEARERDDKVGPIVSGSVEAIAENLDHIFERVSHIEERLDALASQVAVLESRVHEEVE